jgi:hypothetical protein
MHAQLAGRDHLGQHHGHDLQVLDLVVGIDPRSAVLDDQHADRPAPAQQRDAEERVIGVFAGFRTVGEGRVLRGVGQVQRPPQLHDLAHQALARLHAGHVDGGGVEALGCEQLHVGRRAAHVERAHLCDHGARDDPHHHVQARLRRAAPREGFPDLPQQTALTAYGYAGGRHEILMSSLILFRSLAGLCCQSETERADFTD